MRIRYYHHRVAVIVTWNRIKRKTQLENVTAFPPGQMYYYDYNIS